MTLDGVHALLLGLLILLPLSALIARRVPVLRIALNLLSWAAIFGVGLFVLAQREKFDPYLGQIAQALKLDDQTVVGEEVRIRMSPDGHFWARVTVNGVKRRMLVDSGATITALSTSTADAAGLKVKDSLIPVLLRTANGTVQAQTASVDELRFGTIVARKLPVVVSPAFGDSDVLGMNFLSRLETWRVENNTLILTPHHPQDFT
jgi:aspartyl protease family protein